MKVLYAIQATGNGHLTRAKQILPCLKKRMETDVLISGIQGDIHLPFEVKFTHQGYGFIFGKKGGIDWPSTIRKNRVLKFFNEIRKVPISDYDLVITDFEPVSAWAAYLKGIDCIGIGNQYALNLPNFPSPEGKYALSKFVMKHYTPTSRNYPIFYEALNQKTSLPVIRDEIRQMEPSRRGYYLVYLSAIDPNSIAEALSTFKNYKFKVFTRYPYFGEPIDHVRFYSIGDDAFSKALCHANGVITHAGFGLTSEALYLGKPLFVIPMKGQYEQICNAHFLQEKFNIETAPSLRLGLPKIEHWLKSGKAKEVYYPEHTQKWVDGLLSDYLLRKTMFESRPLGNIQTTLG